MMYLDLDELPDLFDERWLWSATGPALARFRRDDHVGPAGEPLAETIRGIVEADAGVRPDGPIRLLTNLSYFGFCFNPVSFYYCFSSTGEHVRYIVAEVNNTPWGETDTYVLDCVGSTAGPWHFSPTKKMHVSPFMSMDIEYSWLLSNPGDSLAVNMSNKRNGRLLFNASMIFRQRPVNGRSLARVLLRFPFMTMRVIVAIYWQALRLWLKRCPIHVHPNKKKEVIAP